MTKANGRNILDDATTIKDCIRRLDVLLERKAIAKKDYADVCKEIAEDIHQVFHDAKAQGLIARSLKTLMVTKLLRDSIDRAVDALDPDALAAYNDYLKASSAWSETPLGKAAEQLEETL